MKQIIKGLAVLLIATPPVGAASILAFGVWTSFMIMLVMISSIRWKKDTGPDQPGEPNWVWMKLKEFNENCDLARRNLQQVHRNSIRPPILLQPLPTVEHETPEMFGEPFHFDMGEPEPADRAPARRKESGTTPHIDQIHYDFPYLERQPRCLKCTLPIRSEGVECTVCGERTPGPTPQ